MNIDSARVAFRDIDGVRYDLPRTSVGVADNFVPDENDRPVCQVFFNGISKWVPMRYEAMRALLHGNTMTKRESAASLPDVSLAA